MSEGQRLQGLAQLCFLASPLFLAGFGNHPSVPCPSKHPALRFWPSARGPPSPALESLRGTLHSRRASQGSHGTSCSPDIQTKLCSLPVETATPEVLPRVSLHSLLLQLAYIRPLVDGTGVDPVQYFSVDASYLVSQALRTQQETTLAKLPAQSRGTQFSR